MPAHNCLGLTGSMQRVVERFGWCHPLQGLSRSSVELVGDVVEVGLIERREAGPLREVLAEKPVGVLVRTTPPLSFAWSSSRIASRLSRSAGAGRPCCPSEMRSGRSQTSIRSSGAGLMYQRTLSSRGYAVTTRMWEPLSNDGLAAQSESIWRHAASTPSATGLIQPHRSGSRPIEWRAQPQRDRSTRPLNANLNAILNTILNTLG